MGETSEDTVAKQEEPKDQETAEAAVDSTAAGDEPMLVEPDLDFIRAATKHGGESLKKCFQCGTCSAVCAISPDNATFPRKEMALAVWGMKDRLVSDPDIWLCHQCGDCSARCPRGSKPGDIMAVARNFSFQHYAFPGLMGKMLAGAKFLPILFGIPVVLILALLAVSGHLGIPKGPIVFEKFFPHFLLDPLFILASLWALTALGVGLTRFWKDVKNDGALEENGAKPGLIPSIIAAVREIALHQKFRECDTPNPRSVSHLLVFYGFVGLFITTTLVFFGLYLPKVASLVGMHFPELTPLPMKLYHPVKILANVSAILFASGLVLMIYQRSTDPEKAGATNYYDCLFLGVMAGLALTGILSELLRLAGAAVLAYPMYFIHLVLVFFLIAYFPYSKFAHVVYRTVAVACSKYRGRT
ncbi:MAG: heterodisulfide reductase subunit E [Planctomycetes bacterium]|nr:heterodisulfide reductase subunit E [Planctomycetota bacterium]